MTDEPTNTEVSPGALLKQHRESQGFSVQDVSTATKINASIIRSLESGNLDGLPAKTFVRGFIRSYAQYLKIDPTPIIVAFGLVDPFIDTMGQTSSVEPEADTPKSKRFSVPQPSVGPRALLMTGIIVLILSVLGVKNIVDKYTHESIPPQTAETESGTPIIQSEPDTGTATTVMDDPALESPSDLNDQIASEQIENTTEVSNDTKEATKDTAESAATPSPENTNTLSEENPPEKLNETKENITDKKLTSSESISPQELIVEALDKVEIEVTIDDGGEQDITLAPSEVRTLKAVRSIVIEISDGGRVNLVHNGQILGAPTDLGKSVELTFPKK